VILSLLTFVPSRYLYSTHPGRLSRIVNVLAAPWAALSIGILLAGPEQRRSLALVSLYFPVFYMGASWWVSLSDGSWRGRP
jgi:phosphatidylcholine synthase